MPYVPNAVTMTANSYDLLNVIRDNASQQYRDYTMSVSNIDDLHKIGNIMMDYPTVANEFINTLINRIGRVLISSRLYRNPLAFSKKGYLQMGETIEEIFVNLIDVYDYDNTAGANEIFKKYKSDVRSAFHSMNFRKMYPVSVSQEQLKTAFLTESGLYDLISKIIESIYTSVSYDEFLVTKYLIARNIINGRMYNAQGITANVIDNTMDRATKAAVGFKAVSNALTFMSPAYNVAGVHNFTDRNSQYLFIKSSLAALVDVEKLAVSFHLDKAEFMGHIIEVDDFAETDSARLAKIFENDPNYTAFTDEQKEALSKVEAVLIDRDYLQIYDNLERMEENRNGVALHHNYFYHAWKTFSVSPFANAVVFTTETESGITSFVAKWYNETMNSTESAPQDYRILREFVEGTEGTGLYVQIPYSVEPVGSVGTNLSDFVLRTEIIKDDLNVVDVKVNDNNTIVLVRNENVYTPTTGTTGFTTFKVIAESGNVKNEQVIRVRVVN